MKRIKFILGFLILIQTVNSQELITDDSVNLKKGIYKTFEEFRYNSPSLPLNYEITLKDPDVAVLKIEKEEASSLGSLWGFCDGKHVFYNLMKTDKPQTEFFRILYIGRYCYFHPYLYNRMLLTNQYFPYAIDFNSGGVLCLNCDINFLFIKESHFKKIMTRDPEFWHEYKNDKSKEDLFLKYIILYSQKYKEDIYR